MIGSDESPVLPGGPLSAGVDGASTCEGPITFPGHGEELFGIVTAPPPAVSPRGMGVVLLNGGACTPSTGRNRFSVKLARRLAALGFHVLRFDYHGVGESTGTVVRYSLNRPFTHDLVAAAAELSTHGISRVLFVGRCFGARTALSALQHVPGVDGIAFISMPLHDFTTRDEHRHEQVRPRFGLPAILGLADPGQRRWYLRALYYSVKKVGGRIRAVTRNGTGPAQDWISSAVVRWLHGAVARGVPLLFLYGATEDHYQEFAQAQSGAVGALLHKAGARAQIVTLDGPVHDLTTIQVQEEIMAQVMTWAVSLTLPRRQAPGDVGEAAPAAGGADA